MDERSFIEQKQQSWEALSKTLETIRARGVKSLSLDQLSRFGEDYRSLVADLSFARSQGASEQLVIYLNELAARAHGAIYVPQSTKLSGVLTFLTRDFPQIFRRTAAYSLVAALIFMLGWTLSAISPEIRDVMFPDQITKPVGDNTTNLQGIDHSLLSTFIMTNNITVGIIAFAGGITAGAYTVFELAKNGLVIGAVASKAVPVIGFVKFWALILPHGVIELMAIFICGAAGLYIGAAIIAPGNLRRVDAVRTASATALRLFAGAIIFFVIAAVIEGFITPSRLSEATKLGFAALTAVGLIVYLGFVGLQSPRALDP